MESRHDQWLRAKALYSQVLGLGVHSVHRADALYCLGWIEYHLGNLAQARAHFDTFISGYPSDGRKSEAEAMTIICFTEDTSQSAEKLASLVELSSMCLVVEKFQQIVTVIDGNINRIPNIGYRTRLQDIAVRAGVRAITQLEDDGDFIQSDVVYRQLRRILAYNVPDTILEETIAAVISKHRALSGVEESGEVRVNRAKVLTDRLATDFKVPLPSSAQAFVVSVND